MPEGVEKKGNQGMPEGAEKIGEQFGGINMESLIGGPLKAACDAQAMLAVSIDKFIEDVGFEKPGTDGTGRVRTETKSSESLEKSSDESGELDANAGLKVGPFHMDAKIKGSISSHAKKNGADNTGKDTEQQ